MEIGSKLKAARTKAELTQEKAAEELGVSRQTISNWENNKTYPDIISVIRMSDLYSVSLDCLLKEENNMSEYLTYLDESTNVVKSKRFLSKLIELGAYLVVWAVLIAVYWLTSFADEDAIGYSLVSLYFVLPVVTLAISVLIGCDSGWGRLKWLMLLFFGIMYMLLEYATFSLSNMIAFNQINEPEITLFIVGVVISAAGMGVGTLIRFLVRKAK